MKQLRNIVCLSLTLSLSPCFAESTPQALLIDTESGSQVVPYEIIDGYAITQGDIILGTEEELKREGALVHRMLNKRWPNGILPYKINSGMPAKNRTYIKQAMDHITQNTNVSFVEVNSTNQNRYKDYVELMPSSSSCSSYVGKIGGRQTISLAPGCKRGASIHELSHALGFWHEQSRSDRDSYVKILWDNIKENQKGNFAIISENGFRMGGYDYGSIMHYGPKDFSKNGKDTIQPLKAGVTIGQRTGLSEVDIEAMNKMYKK